MAEKLAMGIDVGGTNLKCAIINPAGEIQQIKRAPTEADGGRDRVLKNLKRLVRSVLEVAGIQASDLAGIGLGTPGFIVNGGIQGAPNMPGWQGTPIEAIMKETFGVPFFAGNDVTLAAFAESLFGAGRGSRNMVCFAIGTGIGGGLVINGQIYEGTNGMAGELGHVTVVPDGRPCGCGHRGCLEAYSSTIAIKKIACEMLAKEKYRDSAVLKAVEGDLGRVTPKIVYDCAKKGDPLALKVNKIVCRHMAIAIGSIVNTLNPDCIVLGGGVLSAGSIIPDTITAQLDDYALKIMRDGCQVVIAELGEDAGVIGAGALALEKAGLLPRES